MLNPCPTVAIIACLLIIRTGYIVFTVVGIPWKLHDMLILTFLTEVKCGRYMYIAFFAIYTLLVQNPAIIVRMFAYLPTPRVQKSGDLRNLCIFVRISFKAMSRNNLQTDHPKGIPRDREI